jgi:hypothetical protein
MALVVTPMLQMAAYSGLLQEAMGPLVGRWSWGDSYGFY